MTKLHRLLAVPILGVTLGLAGPVHAETQDTILYDHPQQWDDFFLAQHRGAVAPREALFLDDVTVTGSLGPVVGLDERDLTWIEREDIRTQAEDHN